VSYCENSNKISGPSKGGKCIEHINNYQLSKEDSASSLLVNVRNRLFAINGSISELVS